MELMEQFTTHARVWAAGIPNKLSNAAADIGVALETCSNRMTEVERHLTIYSVENNNNLAESYKELKEAIEELTASLVQFPHLADYARPLARFAAGVSPVNLIVELEKLSKERAVLEARLSIAKSEVDRFDAMDRSANSPHQQARSELQAMHADEELQAVKQEMLDNQEAQKAIHTSRQESSAMINLKNQVKSLREDIDAGRKLAAATVSGVQSRGNVVNEVNKLYKLLFVRDGSALISSASPKY